uniref:Uncharacterized protein n=1 Tax=Myotis myotis TaxID=51298 RepID=A0A7J7WHZ7_MYOMY|nr:hypothetical protein mMyoMyo1_012140 [Myotis myotis]
MHCGLPTGLIRDRASQPTSCSHSPKLVLPPIALPRLGAGQAGQPPLSPPPVQLGPYWPQLGPGQLDPTQSPTSHGPSPWPAGPHHPIGPGPGLGQGTRDGWQQMWPLSRGWGGGGGRGPPPPLGPVANLPRFYPPSPAPFLPQPAGPGGISVAREGEGGRGRELCSGRAPRLALASGVCSFRTQPGDHCLLFQPHRDLQAPIGPAQVGPDCQPGLETPPMHNFLHWASSI